MKHGAKKKLKDVSQLLPLRMVYQPIIELVTGKVIGYEALARIGGKPYFPEAVFRRTYTQGQIVGFDLTCFKIAFEVLWRLRKKQVLFVNVEPITLASVFRRGKDVDDLLKEAGRYRHRIVFELTEGMKARDFDYLKKGVSFLRRRGCRFALDDVVGIGSKLFLLAELKPEYIKIGRELVNGVSDNHIQQVLLHRITEVAHRSHSVVIAEGVERKRDLRWLYDHGLSYAQGFYFARPHRALHQKRT